MRQKLARLEAMLEHEFADIELLERALRHRSVGAKNNERLEFLGDAILGFMIAEHLYDVSPGASEGELTRLRASLVRRETLAAVARELDIGSALCLGPGELKSGGRERDSILADALEAIFGAVYLDAGIQACRALILRLFCGRIALVQESTVTKDPKTMLQELLQARGLPLPAYAVVSVDGAEHARSFTVKCEVHGAGGPAYGIGGSRRVAEQQAARAALDLIAND